MLIFIAIGGGITMVSGMEIRENAMQISPDTTNMESSDSVVLNDSLSKDSIKNDSLVSDRVKKKQSNALEHPVYYHATDSNIIYLQKSLIYLYKEAEVVYNDIQVNADFIRVDLDKNELLSYGMPDSTGTTVGKPVFKQGDESFKADTIRYNFKSKRGIIKKVTTEFDGSYMHGARTKRQADKSIHMVNGKFTTCDLEHPHFYFNISKAKVIPDDKIVAGPSYLVIEDIPTPVGIPFGFFPNTKGASSGVIIPEYGEEQNRGFFLRNGGYYWAINNYLDLLLTGGIYSKGSWEARAATHYKIRYKMSGNLSFHYNRNVLGYKGLENYQTNRMYKFKWYHKQDPKAHPSMNFSANVDMSSSAYDKYNTYSAQSRLTNTKQSSINFSKFWPGTPFSLNMSLLHSQNSRDSSVTLTLPQMSFNMSRIYPLKRKEATGSPRIYEKIGISYSMSTLNRVTAHEDSIFQSQIGDFSNGIKHNIPVSTSVKLFKHLTLSPNFNFTDRMYFEETNRYYDDSLYNETDSTYGGVVTEQVQGLVNAWDYRAGANLSTKIYGMFEFKSERLKAIRHVLTPSVSYSYFPDFSDEKYGFYENYISDIQYNDYTGQYDTVRSTYSRFEGGVYGSPPSGGAGSVSFSLSNKLDMKVENPNDTAKKERKIALLESLNFRTNYNIMADSLNWSPLTMTGRTRIGKFNINFSSTFDPFAYMIDSTGSAKRINEMQLNHEGELFRITRASLNLGVGFSASKNKDNNQQARNFLYGYPHSYVDFSIPWNLNFDYTLNYNKPYDEKRLTQTVNVRGDVSVTKKWKVSFNTGYDFVNKKVSYTHVEIHRDLHCWEMSLAFVPFGNNTYYSFQINVKSPLLQDLKLNKRQSFWDNI
ncbi:MAG: putative LPS assembly protein LptD [Candidatus Delongbacteria bacterium]|nr:putative LPS assembly protein LptD [Candidatus Delongbacteria bacterium]